METKKVIWLDKLINGRSILLIGLFVFFILFRDSIWDFYNQKAVSGVFSKIKSHWLIDIVILGLIAFSLIITGYLIFTKRRIANSIFFFSLFLFILFFYCRIFSSKYSFESYYWIPGLKYIDYFFLLFGCLLILKVWSWGKNNKEPVYRDSPFLLDKPIDIANDDKFGRKGFAKKWQEIESKLKVEEAGSLAIGINGSWGSGKTSFTNMIKEHIDGNNRIVIDFNPWRSSSALKIIEDFFELLIS